jgi:hypothetical protein
MAKSISYSKSMPMRIQALKGSAAEKQYYSNSALPGIKWPKPKAIAPGIDPSPMDDLMYHGGKVVPQMQFQNIYLGGEASWHPSDIESIDRGIGAAMRDRRLNNVMIQYFPGASLACDARESFILDDTKLNSLDEPEVQSIVTQLYDNSLVRRRDLDVTLFNLVLPSGTILRLDRSSSARGLGGYHGSVHIIRSGRKITLYYSTNVYSEVRPNGSANGIVAFNAPWKNVVGTLYHELNEFRTDPDVGDAIRSGSNDFLGWTSRQGHEVGDQPIFVATSLNQVFKEVRPTRGDRRIPVQFMYSNAVHGAEGPIASRHT